MTTIKKVSVPIGGLFNLTPTNIDGGKEFAVHVIPSPLGDYLI